MIKEKDHLEEFPEKCPNCGAEQCEEQPQSGTHCCSTVYDCGFQVVECIGGTGCDVEKECSSMGH
jgi:hypothetical protein